jgi:hypothetical protein
MILEACLVSLIAPLQTTAPTFSYGGAPTMDGPQVVTLSANVHFVLAKQVAQVTELVLYKNSSTTAVDVNLVIPRYLRANNNTALPTFPVTATWDKAPIVLADGSDTGTLPANVTSAPLTAKVHFGAGATIPLRISYSTPFGVSGYGGNESEIGFYLPAQAVGAPGSIPQMNISFSYTQRSVFGLPKLAPSWPWQVGQTGAAIRLSNYVPQEQVVTATFYSGGFKPIH